MPAVSLSEKKFDGQVVTYNVRARKTAGSEGFLVVFGAEDDDSYYWFNVGGWNNSQHAIERIDNGSKSVLVQKRGSIRSNTWYTLQVKLSPGRIQCRLDNELIFDYEIDRPSVSVASTLDKGRNELILKLVNPSDEAVNAAVAVDGLHVTQTSAVATVLAGEASAKNTIDDPEVIKPESKQISVGQKFECTLPAMSVQFIRIKVDG
jgi:alpha-L-arabinofuranosidase